jgi:thiol-disulfide isomerase/thioredoxin
MSHDYDALTLSTAAPHAQHVTISVATSRPKHRTALLKTGTESSPVSAFPAFSQSATTSWAKREDIHYLHNRNDFHQLLASFPNDPIVLWIGAPWCPGCRKVKLRFRHLVQQFHEAGSSLDSQHHVCDRVVFAHLAVSETNDPIVAELNVKAFPSFFFFYQQRMYDSFVCTSAEIPVVLKPRMDEFLQHPITYIPPQHEVEGSMNAVVHSLLNQNSSGSYAERKASSSSSFSIENKYP